MKQLAETTLLLGLGANIGTEAEIVERMTKVVAAVQSWGALADSAVYRTAAVGPPQPSFLNAALRISLAPPAWQPAELITAVLEVESLLGRDRRGEERWGPRRMDLDVLLWGPRPVRFAGPPPLEVPHPRLVERRFALEPLADLLDEEIELPGTGRTLAEALRQVSTQDVVITEWKLR